MSDWQPIETAPKDQAPILLAYEVPDDNGPVLETGYGYWTGRGWWRATFDANAGPLSVYDGPEGFFCAWDFRAFATEPKWWRPLPAPPKDAPAEHEMDTKRDSA